MRSAALHYLGQDAIAHMDMLVPLKRGTADVIGVMENEGVLLYERIAGAYMMTAKNAPVAERLLVGVRNVPMAAVHQEFAIGWMTGQYGLRTTMKCRQAVWTRSDPPAAPSSSLDFQVLPPGRAAEVKGLYSHDIGISYIHDRLTAGEMFGAFAGEELAGFIGLHAEGSMGMLEVKPAFRRQGIGRQLIAFLAKRLLAQGQTPFSQFVIENVASQKLHETMGFAISDSLIYWLEQ